MKSTILVQKGKIIFKEGNVADSLNKFFSNSVKNFHFPENNAADTLHCKFFNYPTLQPITKYMNHQRFDNIQSHFKYILV